MLFRTVFVGNKLQLVIAERFIDIEPRSPRRHQPSGQRDGERQATALLQHLMGLSGEFRQRLVGRHGEQSQGFSIGQQFDHMMRPSQRGEQPGISRGDQRPAARAEDVEGIHVLASPGVVDD